MKGLLFRLPEHEDCYEFIGDVGRKSAKLRNITNSEEMIIRKEIIIEEYEIVEPKTIVKIMMRG